MYFGDVLDAADLLHDYKVDKPFEFDNSIKQSSIKLKSSEDKSSVSHAIEFKGDPFAKANLTHKTVLNYKEGSEWNVKL
jgi:hypothetical protein